MPEYLDYPLAGEHVQAAPDALTYIDTYQLTDGVVEIVDKIRALMPDVRAVRMDVFEDPTCDCEPELRLYAMFPVRGAVVLARVLPATRGRSLDELEETQVRHR